jgi:pantoate--beta-alanine ligase
VILLPTIAETRTAIAVARAQGHSIGIVPTMGALHEGHGELIRRARAENGYVVVTLFVNPTQFDRKEDLERYPRTLETDRGFCEVLGADAIFAPAANEMYPIASEERTWVEVGGLSTRVEGAHRPGHFRGVATVVTKLFNIVQADRAYFGEKDAQQLAVIQKMVADLNQPIAIVPVPTVRESDGLAISSRNRLLSAEERAVAPALYRALQAAAQAIASGADTAVEARASAAASLVHAPGLRVEYLEFVDPASFEPLEVFEGPVRIVTAAWLGKVRLIDNVLVVPRE